MNDDGIERYEGENIVVARSEFVAVKDCRKVWVHGCAEVNFMSNTGEGHNNRFDKFTHNVITSSRELPDEKGLTLRERVLLAERKVAVLEEMLYGKH